MHVAALLQNRPFLLQWNGAASKSFVKWIRRNRTEEANLSAFDLYPFPTRYFTPNFCAGNDCWNSFAWILERTKSLSIKSCLKRFGLITCLLFHAKYLSILLGEFFFQACWRAMRMIFSCDQCSGLSMQMIFLWTEV